MDVYSPGILPTSLRHELASKHALAQEENLFARSNKMTYRNSIISAVARLKKRSPARNVEDTGTLEDEAEKLAKLAEEEKGRLTRKRVEKFVHDAEKLRVFDYMLEVPEGLGGDKETEVGGVRTCDRCKKEFLVKADLSEVRCPPFLPQRKAYNSLPTG
jgi:RNA exonuclease 1